MRSAFATMVVGSLAAGATAQPIRCEPFAAGLVEPVMITHVPADASRLFVAERAGKVVIVDVPSGTLLATPYLNIDPVVKAGPGDTGLLGLAFDPQYATNGLFYVSYTDEPNYDNVVMRYKVSAGNPNQANAESAALIWRYQRPLGHTSGWIGFRPTDGYLYCGSGDAGTFVNPDPLNASQRLDLVFGKILRIDPSSDQFPNDPNRNYAIPPGNPFAATPGASPEIWARGIRNPWRCSFDRETGDFWIADVGENMYEEIIIETPLDVGGKNYGWRCLEAVNCTGYGGCDCADPTISPASIYYHHDLGISITGGHVYRGSEIPYLQGRYLFADFGTSVVLSTDQTGGGQIPLQNHTLQTAQPAGPIELISCLGEDADGELYITAYAAGVIYRVTGYQCYADIDESGSKSIDDFVYFQTLYAVGDGAADCDSTGDLSIDDFICFQTYYAVGC